MVQGRENSELLVCATSSSPFEYLTIIVICLPQLRLYNVENMLVHVRVRDRESLAAIVTRMKNKRCVSWLLSQQ
jgi:hypothetical protein